MENEGAARARVKAHQEEYHKDIKEEPWKKDLQKTREQQEQEEQLVKRNN